MTIFEFLHCSITRGEGFVFFVRQDVLMRVCFKGEQVDSTLEKKVSSLVTLLIRVKNHIIGPRVKFITT